MPLLIVVTGCTVKQAFDKLKFKKLYDSWALAKAVLGFSE